MRFATTALLSTLVLVGCNAPGDDRVLLDNSNGKSDGAAVRFRLTGSNPSVGLGVRCDQAGGCEGTVKIRVVSPEACKFFPSEPRCGATKMPAMAAHVATATLTSSTEGTRELPVEIRTGDGKFFAMEISAAWSALPDEEIDVMLQRTADAPDMVVELTADWIGYRDPGSNANALRAFLASVPGMTVKEVATQYRGYRAFRLDYEQPLDHKNPTAGSFKQAAFLHFRDKAAPMVLYSSGYALDADYVTELGESLKANQLTTEQRMFGTSWPDGKPVTAYRYVNIEQAANDHHRFVEALKPFFQSRWLNTGHSKGGMTAVFHRRFFPGDLDATVAYVAPMSFAAEDPRYIPFLDSIGDATCRANIRRYQRAALAKLDEILPIARAHTESWNMTYTRAGGFESAMEKGVLWLEWVFWQYHTLEECAPFETLPTDAAGLYELMKPILPQGFADSIADGSVTYYYQALTQLGKQAIATAHVADLIKHADKPYDFAPAGTTPVHNPAAINDVLGWVRTAGTQLLFIYGEWDPWTAGAFQVDGVAGVTKLVAPHANHSAAIQDLAPDAREIALERIERWIGQRPQIKVPGGSPTAPSPDVIH